jgi:endonuclease/exonuclease/phosphatase (EEP) superfamily protein YafD
MIQQVVGYLLYYGRAVDPTILTSISALASQQATATEDTHTNLLQILNYCASHPDSKIRSTASVMILNIHSDAGYLNEFEARSRAGEHFLMKSKPRNGEQQHKVALLTLWKILRMVAYLIRICF